MRLKIYLVEDSQTIRDNLIATLEELIGINTVGTAETENQGAEWLTNSIHAWDLAIIDLFLAQGTGLGIISACKNRLPHQKAIVVSNYATPHVRKQCKQLGADAVFDKSTEIELLIDYCLKLSQL